jgi:NitT/TauT family transport system permease protein
MPEAGSSRSAAPLPAAARGLGLPAIRLVVDSALPVVVAVGALVAWELVVRVLLVPEVLLPPPSRIAAVFAVADNRATLLQNLWPTALQAVSGFTTAALLGVIVALAVTYSAAFKEAIHPYLVAFQVIPKIALAPIFVLWFGIGFASRFVFATFVCFFPIVIALIAGLRDTHPDVIRMCRAVGATRTQILWQVRLPFATPYLFAGLKIAATMSIIGVVIGEFITADRGLGYFILYAASRSDTPMVKAAILLLCIVGLLIFGLVVAAESLVLRRQGMQ